MGNLILRQIQINVNILTAKPVKRLLRNKYKFSRSIDNDGTNCNYLVQIMFPTVLICVHYHVCLCAVQRCERYPEAVRNNYFQSPSLTLRIPVYPNIISSLCIANTAIPLYCWTAERPVF